MPSLQRFAPTIRGTHAGPFNDRCGSVTYWERCDFRWGSKGDIDRRPDWVCFAPNRWGNRPAQLVDS